ncbi:hypothetical protein ACKF11_13630 [Methylobacillus sp. Pita2]|uniref:hypothetical protein n=1 Tax=Methylobacillus sp. Pita2 TaxID=3383245 RepID=UPI0038B68A82
MRVKLISAITVGFLAPLLSFAGNEAIPLDKLVSEFLTTQTVLPAWSMGATQSTPQINWISNGVDTRGCGIYSSCRRGLARVSVSGEEMQSLRQRLEPIQWDLFMASSNAAKFGPEKITISPLCDSADCWFDFEKGMATSGITMTRLCQAGPGLNTQTAYLLTKGTKSSVAILHQSAGSGGVSAFLEMIFSVDPKNKDWCAEARKNE